MNIAVEDVTEVFPRPLLEEEETRVAALITQSLELIDLEFARRSRVLAVEVVKFPWLQTAVKQAVRVMVSQAVLIGDNVGRASAASTTGPQSDQVTWSQGIPIHWGGVGIDSAILDLLGLMGGAVPQGQGGIVIPYGHRAARSEWRWS